MTAVTITSTDQFFLTSPQIFNNITTTPHIEENPFGHSLSDSFSSFAAACFILIIITSVFCNTILIVTIILVKKLHSVTHIFIVNLAVSDLITVLGTVPFDVELMLKGYFPYGNIACGIMQTTFLISLPSSVLNLSLLTAERLITVTYPLRRIMYLSKNRVILAVIATWSYTFIVAFYPVYSDSDAIIVEDGMCYLMFPFSYNIFQIIANFLVPILFICYANITLYMVSRRHASTIRRYSTRLGSFVNEEERTKKRQSLTKISRRKSLNNFNANIKAAKRIALLVGVFLVCWLSYIILVATNVSCGACHPRELTWMGNVVNYSSSAVNPLIYGLLNKTIRDEIVMKVNVVINHCFKPRQRQRGRSATLVVELNYPNGESLNLIELEKLKQNNNR